MLETIWFILWGLLWAIYFMLDGFDLGLGALLPVVSRSERDRRVVYNAMGPFWDGNEVWLITAGGATFAAFPGAYATMFSAMYSALMLILFALIFRGVSFEFRGKVDSSVWRRVWDTSMIVGSGAPAFLFGVAFANIFAGIPIDGQGILQGNLLTFLNPYALAGGVFFLALFMMHGALWLTIKADGDLCIRSARLAAKLWIPATGLAVVFLAVSYWKTNLYSNYFNNPVLFIIPLGAVIGLFVTRLNIGKKPWTAWFGSSAAIVFSTLFGVAGLYPNLLPSSLKSDFSLTIYNASSSTLTLKIMLGTALIFVPTVIVYQSFVYNLFKHKITDEDLAAEEAY